MPTIEIGQHSIDCKLGSNLRKVLMEQRVRLYNGPMRAIHCRGLGTCGTCAVRVEGEVSEPTAVERWRLEFPPHKKGLEHGLRLACQCRVEGDLKVSKQSGWWGQTEAGTERV